MVSIITFDETSFRLVPVYKRVWFFKGEKPKGVFFWSNNKLIIFRALIDGKKLFYEFYDSMNTLTYKAFLSSFVDAPYHKSSSIKNYLKEFDVRLSALLHRIDSY